MWYTRLGSKASDPKPIDRRPRDPEFLHPKDVGPKALRSGGLGNINLEYVELWQGSSGSEGLEYSVGRRGLGFKSAAPLGLGPCQRLWDMSRFCKG